MKDGNLSLAGITWLRRRGCVLFNLRKQPFVETVMMKKCLLLSKLISGFSDKVLGFHVALKSGLPSTLCRRNWICRNRAGDFCDALLAVVLMPASLTGNLVLVLQGKRATSSPWLSWSSKIYACICNLGSTRKLDKWPSGFLIIFFSLWWISGTHAWAQSISQRQNRGRSHTKHNQSDTGHRKSLESGCLRVKAHPPPFLWGSSSRCKWSFRSFPSSSNITNKSATWTLLILSLVWVHIG